MSPPPLRPSGHCTSTTGCLELEPWHWNAADPTSSEGSLSVRTPGILDVLESGDRAARSYQNRDHVEAYVRLSISVPHQVIPGNHFDLPSLVGGHCALWCPKLPS